MVMRNPLNKRIFREFRSEFGKYAVIFLFMVLTIGLESGDMVASDSMIATCNERYQKYHVENGHFHLKQAMKSRRSMLFSSLPQQKSTSFRQQFFPAAKDLILSEFSPKQWQSA